MKKTLLIIILAISMFADSYVIKKTNLYKNFDKNVLAEITKGTKVEILKTKGDYSLVKIKGWSYEDAPNNKIFFKQGVTVNLASLNKEGLKLRKNIQSKEDEYEEIWIENSIKGWIKTNLLTNNFKSLWKMEANFISVRCSACHDAPEPHQHFAGEFPSLLKSMAEQAGLTKKEERILINYLQKSNIYTTK